MRVQVTTSFSSEYSTDLVLDTSVAINLACTGMASEILIALDRKVRIPARVLSELRSGRVYGYDHADAIEQLLDMGGFELAPLQDDSLTAFFDLVSGAATDSLGDGEAATIAIALKTRSVAVIDERKARKIIRLRHPSLATIMTMDLLLHREVTQAFPMEKIDKAVINALQLGRMQVATRHYEWLAERLDSRTLESCPSLKRLNRQAKLTEAQK